MKHFVLALLLSLYVSPIFAQEAKPDDAMKDCPMHDQHAAHHATVEKNSDEAMGFPHDKTTHHFRLLPDGGAIEVTTKDRKDTQNVQAIRSHLARIAVTFTNGDFSVPMFVHSQVPPGVTEMKDKRAEISYSFEELADGGRVRITTENKDALNAVHDFLTFQIEDHHTRDKTE
jgi:hypothetical protein